MGATRFCVRDSGKNLVFFEMRVPIIPLYETNRRLSRGQYRFDSREKSHEVEKVPEIPRLRPTVAVSLAVYPLQRTWSIRKLIFLHNRVTGSQLTPNSTLSIVVFPSNVPEKKRTNLYYNPLNKVRLLYSNVRKNRVLLHTVSHQLHS